MALKPHNQSSPQMIGILLLYYEPFAAEATRRFIDFLRSVRKDYVVVIVKNQELELPPFDQLNIHVIKGDNTLREFTGWQVGLEYCKKQQLIPCDGIVVFANDTFCHHNKFGPITHWCFQQNFKKLLEVPQVMALAGEVHSSEKEFCIDNKNFSKWVSTYLFAVTPALLDRLDSLAMPLNLDRFFTGEVDPNRFLTGNLNENLKHHLKNYLFNTHGLATWYGVAPLSKANLEQFVGKAKSILCEMYLSATAINLGAQVVSVFNTNFLQQTRRLERLLPRYRNKPIRPKW